jgi:hypothetical protein
MFSSSVALCVRRIYSRQDYGKIRCLNLATITQIKIVDPGKSSSFKALVVQDEAIRIPEQKLHPVTTTTKKNKYMPAQGIHPKMRRHQSG